MAYEVLQAIYLKKYSSDVVDFREKVLWRSCSETLKLQKKNIHKIFFFFILKIIKNKVQILNYTKPHFIIILKFSIDL